METNGLIWTLGELMCNSATVHGARPALVFPDSRKSYAELDAAARSWAATFIALGARPGDNVGILLNTRSEFIEILFGIAMAGCAAVPINARYQSSELAFLIKDADVQILVTTREVVEGVDFSQRLVAALPSLALTSTQETFELPEAPRLRTVVCLDSPSPPYLLPCADAKALGARISDAEINARIAAVDPGDVAIVLYTSGTTAEPKGAVITHRGQIGNSRNLGARYEVTKDDRVWSPLPIYHTGGILPLVMCLDSGGAYITMSRFDAGDAIHMLAEEKATIAYPTFVTILQDLVNHPSFRDADLSSLRVMNSNFAVQPLWIKEAVMKALPHTIQVSTYGLTEGAGTISTSRLTDTEKQRTERCGVPLDDWEVRIVDPDSGQDCKADEKGEIVLRGPNMFKGYYNAPLKNAEVLRDGWFHTGDIGSFDVDGQLMFHGRTKDMLKVGGENVAAIEIETMLENYSGVKLAQVFAIPDDRYGEVPAAFVEMSDPASFDEAALIAHCKGKIANFKVPRHVRLIDQWPMSTSKIQKFRLQQRLLEELLWQKSDF